MKRSDEILLLGMIMLLVLNDHVLKQWIPGFITGKISDLAGPFVVYRLLRGIPPWGFRHKIAALISVVFAMAVKTSQPLADLVAKLSCGWIFSHCSFIADPWDILAFMPFAVWAYIRMLSPLSASPGASPER